MSDTWHNSCAPNQGLLSQKTEKLENLRKEYNRVLALIVKTEAAIAAAERQLPLHLL